jgi:hypothetical protein
VKALILLGLAGTAITACVGARIYETAPIEAQMIGSIEKSDQVTLTAEQDYNQKFEMVQQLTPRSTTAVKAQLNRDLTSLSNSIQKVRLLKLRQKELDVKFNALSKGKFQISSGENDFDLTEKLISDFESTTLKLNTALSEYSLVSSSLANFVSSQNLFLMTDVANVSQKLKFTVDSGRRSLNGIDTQIGKAEQLATANGTSLDLDKRQTLSTERDFLAEKIEMTYKLLTTIKKDFPQGKISSLDPKWSKLQKTMAEAEVHAQEIQSLTDRLPKEIESLMNHTSR